MVELVQVKKENIDQLNFKQEKKVALSKQYNSEVFKV